MKKPFDESPIDCLHSNLLLLYPLYLEVFACWIHGEFHIIKNKHFAFLFAHHVCVRPEFQVSLFVFSFSSHNASPYLATTRRSRSIPEIDIFEFAEAKHPRCCSGVVSNVG